MARTQKTKIALAALLACSRQLPCGRNSDKSIFRVLQDRSSPPFYGIARIPARPPDQNSSTFVHCRNLGV